MYMTFYKPNEKYVAKEKEDSPLEFDINKFFEHPELYLKEDPTEQSFEFQMQDRKITISKDKEELRRFFEKHKTVYWNHLPKHPDFPTTELKNHYSTFFIPKKTGGLRQIDAPDTELKSYLTQLSMYFTHTLNVLPHNAAHAYVKNRSTITALKVHQRTNKQNWFLKLDFHAFFPSHNIEYILSCMENIYPIGFLMENEKYRNDLKEALSYAFLESGELPQGTPLSPALTNICMVGLDYDIQEMLYNEIKAACVYTRYADDLLISSPYKVDYLKIQKKIIKIIKDHNAPFTINTKKTRFGSKNGTNWNLGLMLNKDNNITIGHKNAQRFRASINNILRDFKGGVRWSCEDRGRLNGIISYYKAIEPKYIDFVIKRYEEKYGVKLKDALIIK